MKRTTIMVLLRFIDLVRHDDRLRKTCNSCIIQRKEKVSWRKEETGRKSQKKGKNKHQGKGKCLVQQDPPQLLPWACSQPCRAKMFANGDATGLCFVWLLGHL